jgi:hypothetical protein
MLAAALPVPSDNRMMFFAIAPAPPSSRHAGANLAVNEDARKRIRQRAPPEFYANFGEDKNLNRPAIRPGGFATLQSLNAKD